MGINRAAVAAGLVALAISLLAMARDITQPRLENTAAEPENWFHVNGNYASQRFVNLSQINRTNVKDLRLSMMVLLAGQTPAIGGRNQTTNLEGTPLVEGGFMYVVDGWGAVYKIDVRSGRRMDFVWKMDPQIDKIWAADTACCGINNRGVALWKDQVISLALDGRLFATNKESGQLTWEVKVADPAIADTLTVAPMVVRDMAIYGQAGADYGIRGWIEATNLTNGKAAWRTHTAGGNDRNLNEKAKSTWKDPDNAGQTGGGSIWQTGSFDPALNLMYCGTGNAGQTTDSQYRPGDNLYTSTTLAMNPDDGFIKWFFQYTPNDPMDLDEMENPLVDIMINGELKKWMVHQSRGGYFYAFDRASGQFQYATQVTALVTWTQGIDPKSGRPLSYNPMSDHQTWNGTAPMRGGIVGTRCPSAFKMWEPIAVNPVLGYAYVPGVDGCRANYVTTGAVHFEGKLNGTQKLRTGWTGAAGIPKAVADAQPPAQVANARHIQAINISTGKVVQKVFLDQKQWGYVTTAGNLVFGADSIGDIYAYDATTLEQLWVFNVGTGIKAPPMSFAVAGKQYVAVMAGTPAASSQQRPGTRFMTPSNYVFVFSL